MQRELRVLVVEDEPRYRAFLVQTLGDMDCTAVGAASTAEADRLIDTRTPDALMLDLHLPVEDGLTFLARFRRGHPDAPVVIVTGFGDLGDARRAIQLGVTEFLTKPCHLGEIERALDRVRRQLARGGSMPDEPPPAPASVDADRSLAAIERDAIIDTLREHGGNRSATATALGISRRALYNKIEQYRRDGFDVT